MLSQVFKLNRSNCLQLVKLAEPSRYMKAITKAILNTLLEFY